MGPLSGGSFASPPLDPFRRRAMAAVAPQPVVVNSPTENPTADCPICFDANSPVVSATPFLDWQLAPAGPGGQARMQLMTFQAVIAFLPRCSISRRVVDQAAARAVNVLTMRLTDSAWSRILTELLTAQVFTQPANSLNELHAFMRDAIFPAPARLEIVADDWHHAEAFAMPTGTDAAAVAARQQLEPIQFLSLVNALDVEEPMALLPLSLFSTIVAFVGPCLTQAARRTGASSVQLAASILRVHLASTACTDAQLAAKVAPFVKQRMLPHQIHNLGASEGERREDLEDGIEYHSSSQGRQSIEEKRIQLLGVGLGAFAAKLCDDLQADAACRGHDPSVLAAKRRHAHLLIDRYAVYLSLGSHPLPLAASPWLSRACTGVGRASLRCLRHAPIAHVRACPLLRREHGSRLPAGARNEGPASL